MALKLGNFQSPKKASNPSIQIPDEAPVQVLSFNCISNQYNLGYFYSDILDKER